MATARDTSYGLGELRDTYERVIDGWLRRGLNGWRFTDNQGRVYRLDDAQGEQLHREAHDKVAELFAGLEGQAWYMLIPAMLVGFLAIKMSDEFLLYDAMPTAVYFVPCLLFLFKDVIREISFAWAMNKWREELAQRIRVQQGREAEGHDYSLWRDERLMVWIGWALFGPGLVIAMLLYDNFDTFFLAIGMMVAGAFVLRSAYGLD